jgi:predicted XRE-type DNA-binding protein
MWKNVGHNAERTYSQTLTHFIDILPFLRSIFVPLRKTPRPMNQGEIVIYQTQDGKTELNVNVGSDTVWLTQAQIAMLFGVRQPAVSKHLKNIFADGELDENSVHSILEYTAADGKNYATQFYNLDAILSVGYRVNTKF